MQSVSRRRCAVAVASRMLRSIYARLLCCLRSAACLGCYCGMLVAFAGGAACFYLVMRLHIIFVEPERVPQIARLYIHRGAHLLFASLQRIGLMQVKMDPLGVSCAGTVVIANHPSMLDAMLLLSAIPNAVCVMKRPLLRFPVIGGFARWARYIPQAETPELLESALQALADGASIIIFPEGTRSDRVGIRAFKRGAARLALEASRPIVPVLIVMKPVVFGVGWPVERPPLTSIKYEAVRLEALGAESTVLGGGAADDLRAMSMRLTQHLEDLIANSLL